MNPHYHPYGGAAELTSPPHPPSPDNAGNYHPGHPGHPRMHPAAMAAAAAAAAAANGHTMGHPMSGGPGGGHPGGGGGGHPGDHPSHPHHPHPAFTNQGPPSDGSGGPHGPHNPSLGQTNNTNNAGSPNNNNNNNGSVKVCAGCGGKIVERFLLHALDRYWHNGCLKCSCCAAMLADLGTSCFTKGGMILCKQDYMRSRRLFGNSGACSACGQTIPASEFVMRSGAPQPQGAPPHHQQHPQQTHVFHLKCFMCSKCLAPLVPGDRYYMLSGSLVCEQDWHKLLKSTAAAQQPPVRKGKVGRPRRSRD